jgi:hypothetical protein
MGIAIDLFLAAVEKAVTDPSFVPEEGGVLTPDVGALVRDKGQHVALEAARVRQRVGYLHDVANCAAFVLPRHRRRLR